MGGAGKLVGWGGRGTGVRKHGGLLPFTIRGHAARSCLMYGVPPFLLPTDGNSIGKCWGKDRLVVQGVGFTCDTHFSLHASRAR